MAAPVVRARAHKVTWELVKGDTMTLGVTIVDSAGDPIDKSASQWEAYWLPYASSSATPTELAVDTSQADEGRLVITADDDVTSALTRTGVWWLSEIVDNEPSTFLDGPAPLKLKGAAGVSSGSSELQVTVDATEVSVEITGGLASVDIDDINATGTPSASTYLRGDGTWAAASGSATLDDLTDVTITAAASGDILRHNGTAWVDTPGTTHFEAAGAVAAHEADTTSVHGIADTSALLTTSSAPELIRDTIGTALVAGSNITITPNDGADTITIAASGGSVATDSIFDAKGDLPVGTGADTASRLAVGTNGYGVTADSSTSTGLRWASMHRSPNSLGNSWCYVPGMIRTGGIDAGFTCVANVTYYIPFYADAEFTFDALICNVNTTSAGANVRLAVIRAGDDWKPASSGLLADSGALSVATTGVKTGTFTAVTGKPGPHLLGIRSDGTPAFKSWISALPSGVTSASDPSFRHATRFSVSESYAAFASSPTAWDTIGFGDANTSQVYVPVFLRATS